MGQGMGRVRRLRKSCRVSLRLRDLCAMKRIIQLLNQDMYLAQDYFEKIVAMMEEHPEAGAGQGVLLKWDFGKASSVERLASSNSLTDIVDTMGLKVMRNRRVADWRTGKLLNNVIASGAKQSHRWGEEIATTPSVSRDDEVYEVFGVSGALPIYRRKAVEQVAFEGQMFDEDFFSYKEDVDLAFRLRAAGWKAYVDPQAQAWHDRSAAGPREMSDKAALQNRKTKSAFVNYHSYKNHVMVLLKNENLANFARDWPWILWYEFKKFVYLLLLDRATLKGLKEIKRLRPRTMQKRKFITSHYKLKPEEMRKWFC
ncbi:MAG: hypothetical protein UX17_C0056G0004 [Parcubacteria group bacterium GW2011_GWC2_45_7]|nr:MAG: hypothetical protein UX17_C0056G0004 [Parcubacteria group bacterium GW2011_GWC2_45_7]